MSLARRNVTEEYQVAVAERARLRAEARELLDQIKQKQAHVSWLIETIRRQWEPGFHEPLQKAIRVMHGCEAEHKASFAVRKVAAGKVVWDGIVEEFRLVGHRQAKFCYAWLSKENGRTQSFSLLKRPPVSTPQRAVQMALAARELGAVIALAQTEERGPMESVA